MQQIFEGNISVKAALQSPYRKINRIVVDSAKHDKDTHYILKLAHSQNIPIEKSNREMIDELASGHTHGGLIAYAGERTYQDIDDIYSDHCFIALIEGIEDPFNYGQALRNLYAAGCDGIITSTRNWSNAAAVVAKSSAGASEYLKQVVSEDFTETISKLKAKGVQLVCALRSDDSIVMYDYDFTQPVCICIGGEKRGLSKDVLTASDQNIFIPYNQDFRNALGAASATTIIAYELLRQRRKP